MPDSTIKELTFGFASRVGIGKTALRLANSFHQLGEFDVDRRIREYDLQPSETDGDVLITFTQGQGGTNAYRHCILAHAFQVRGYNPVLPLCDADIPRCHRQSLGNTNEKLCDKCNYVGTEILDAFGLTGTPLTELTSEYRVPFKRSELKSFDTYKCIPVADYARASTRKFLKKYHIDFNSSAERDTYRYFLESATRLVDACETLFDRHDFVAVVGDHDNYVYGGIYLEYANQRGIPAYSHAMGYRDQTFFFGNKQNRSSIPPYSDEQVVQQLLEQPLSQAQKNRIEEIMSARAKGNDTRIHYSARTDQSVEARGETTTLGVFTNLVWDASLLVEDRTWADVFEWIDATIEFARSTDDIRFIIKTHPAEAVLGTNESVMEWINENHKPLPDTITILPPDTEVNTYELLNDIDAGVVFNSTVGLEMAYNCIPTVVAGDAHYMGFGFTHDVANRSEYHAILSNPPTRMTDMEIRLARRYAYLLFVRKHLEFPFVEHADGEVSPTQLPISHDEITPGNETFDFIVEQIISNKPVIQESL